MKRSTTTPYFVMLIVMFVFSFGLANFQSTISLYVDHKYGYTPAQIAVIITVGGFVGVIAQTFVINKLFKTIWRNARHSSQSYHRRFCNDWDFICQFVLDDSFRGNGFLHCHISSSSCRQYTRFETRGGRTRFCSGHDDCVYVSWKYDRTGTCGYLFDINIIYPYIIGTIILLICFVIASYWAKRSGDLLSNL